MVSYKLDKYDRIFIAFVCALVTLFNIGQCFADSDEVVELTSVSNLGIQSSGNFFVTSTSSTQYYCQLEKGYIYTIHDERTSGNLSFCFCNDVPALNVVYYDLTTIEHGSTYNFIVNDNYDYLYLSGTNLSNDRYVTRRKIASQENAVNDLVNNVGLDNFWSVFEGGIDFVGVVVLVAFGLFLVILAIKKVSKGKSEF